MQRVVVTGLGLVTPLGDGVEATWKRLIAGRSGIRGVEHFDVSDLPARIAGQIPKGDDEAAFRATDYVDAKDVRKNDAFIIYGIAAATQALRDSGWEPKT